MLLDTDQYSGTKGGLTIGVPHLLPKGLIIVDDTTVHGVDEAIKESQIEFPGLVRCNVLENFDLLYLREDGDR